MADDVSPPPFVFNPNVPDEVKKNLDLQINALETRIDKLINANVIGGHQILMHLLGLTHDKDDLERLGKSVQRVAPLVGQLDDLKRKRDLIKWIEEQPTWLPSVFGSFAVTANDVETFLASLESLETDTP